MLFIGIDPGAQGGLAAINQDGKVFALTSMPDSFPEVYAWFKMFEGISCTALLEQVSGYIGEAHPGSRMFEFGRGYGGLEMALAATGIEHDYILPQRWQKGLGLRHRTKGEDDTSFKNYLKDEASKRFPRIRVTKATADALLIAHFLRYTKGKVM